MSEQAQRLGPAEDGPPADEPLLRDVEPFDLSDLADPNTVLEVLGGAIEDLVTGFVARVPLLVLAAVVVVLALLLVRVSMRLVDRGLERARIEFAVQNLLENLVAGLLILIRKPFGRGDETETNGFAGTVEDVDLRVTRVRDFDGQLVLVPNAARSDPAPERGAGERGGRER